jgi:hypothetical protein
MKVLVENREVAIEVCRMLQEICGKIRHNRDIPDVLQTVYEAFLCGIRDCVEIAGEPEEDKNAAQQR